MGIHAAHCMTGSAADTGTSFAFELFTHATRFMGQKVVLLGLYNGQRLEQEPESDMVTYSRATEVCFDCLLLIANTEHGRTGAPFPISAASVT